MRTFSLTNAEVVTNAIRGCDGESSTGNFSTRTQSYVSYWGHLPEVWQNVLSDAVRDERISQVIYSYSTPIAWLDSEYGWIIPRVTYSVTTSGKHQSQLYRLHGRHILLPWDASRAEVQRVLDGKMIFETDRYYGLAVRTVPGPNYVEGE